MVPGAQMPPIFGRPPDSPKEPPEELLEDVLTEEELGIIANRWRNLFEEGFTAEEAFALCSNPGLDWHYAARLRAKGCPFEIILDLTSP